MDDAISVFHGSMDSLDNRNCNYMEMDILKEWVSVIVVIVFMPLTILFAHFLPDIGIDSDTD